MYIIPTVLMYIIPQFSVYGFKKYGIRWSLECEVTR